MSDVKAKNWISIIGVLFLLVILPAGSWYYLRSGLDYRLASLDELKDYGKIPVFGTQINNGLPLTEEELKSKMVLTAFYGEAQSEQKEALGQILSRLHHQFDKRDDVVILVYSSADSIPGDHPSLEPFITRYELGDTLQCLFLEALPEEISQKAEAYQIPKEAINPNGIIPYIAFTDREMTIRKFYDFRSVEEMKSLVEHVAMLLPKKKERDLVFKREKEK